MSLLHSSLPSNSTLPHLRPFLLRLSSLLLPSLPSLASILLPSLHIPDLREWREEEEEDPSLCPLLLLLSSLFLQEGQETSLHHHLSSSWTLLLLPLAKHSLQCHLYTRRASLQATTGYIHLCLRLTRDQTRECRVREELARDLEGLLQWGREKGRLAEVAQLLCETLEGLKQSPDRDTFLFPLVLKCLDFSSLLDPRQWLRPPPNSLLSLYLLTQDGSAAPPLFTAVFHSPACPPSLLKHCVRLAAERPLILPSLLPSIMKHSALLHLLLSLPSLPSLPLLHSHLSSLLTSFSLDPTEDSREVRAASVFLTRQLSSGLLNPGELLPLLPTLLDTASLHLSVGESLRSCIVDLLAALFSSLPSPSSLNLPDLCSKLCSLATNPSHWPVQDSALSCLSSLLSNPSLSPLLAPSLTLILSSLQLCLSPHHYPYIRSSSLATLSSLLSSPASSSLSPTQCLSTLPCSSPSSPPQLHLDPDTFFESWDESSRRQLVKTVTALYTRLLGQQEAGSVLRLLEQFVLLLLWRDQDWEVKLLTADFWVLSVKHDGRRDVWMTALVLGGSDYESSVRARFCGLVEELGVRRLAELAGAGGGGGREESSVPAKLRKIEKREDVAEAAEREEYIEDILEEPYEDLLENVIKRKRVSAGSPGSSWTCSLPEVGCRELVAWLGEAREDRQVEPVDKLLTVLEDILHSTQEGNLIDLVDCY